MRQPVCDGDGDDKVPARKVVPDDGGAVRAARRRRRLELRRHGSRKTFSGCPQDEAAARKARLATDDGVTGSDSSLDHAGGGPIPGVWPACLSHGAASVIGRRREMEDAVAVAPAFLSDDEEFFAVYDGHGGARVAEACRDRMHVVLAEELRRRRLGAGADGARGWKEAML